MFGALGHGQQLWIQRLLDRMILRQGSHPPGQIEIQLFHRERIQKLLKNFQYVLLLHGQAVHRKHTDSILLLQLLRQQLGLGGVRIPGVQQHQKGLPRLLHVSHRPCLRLQIVVPRDIGDASIGGHHHANGTVILHDLPGSQLCCLGHGDLMVIPWRCHHSRLSVLLCAHGPGHHIAHRVNEAHPKPGFSVR